MIYQIIKRDGNVVPYNDSKITAAVTKAILSLEGTDDATSHRVAQLAEKVTVRVNERVSLSSNPLIGIEIIQNCVEETLSAMGEYKIARAYILYREARAKERENHKTAATLMITLQDGTVSPLRLDHLRALIADACEGLIDVDSELIEKETLANLYNLMPEKDVLTALVIATKPLVELDPNYSYVTARLLMCTVRSEALSYMGLNSKATYKDMESLYKDLFETYLTIGVSHQLIDKQLLTFDLDALSNALDYKKDNRFTYLGLQTLYDRYFLHKDDVRFELPQAFFMRVAMGLSLNEENKTEKAIEFYNLLSDFDYMTSTPTLFNSGTPMSQLSSCFLTTVPDDLHGIFGSIQDNAMLSKYAGGLGNDWSNVRALGSHIKGTNGKSQGVIPFLKVANDTAVAVNQGGKRKGAVCAYLETWHLDIEEFLELRKNTGDDRRRTHDMSTANWIPDLFMKRVFTDGTWTLFSPSDVGDLHDLYGSAFDEAYCRYEKLAAEGKIKLSKVVNAKDLWRKMLSMIFETGHPWLTFKDPCNVRSPQQHVGVVHSSNLCTEITLNTSADEVAVCNLGSVNLVKHIVNGKLDRDKLKKTVTTAVRMLDNVIDINYYTLETAKTANQRHRPIGLGIMGFQDALYLLKIPYGSDEAVKFADESMELISYYAIEASCDLALERGRYQSFHGSTWSNGYVPLDTLELLKVQRGEEYLNVNTDSTLNWEPLRARVRQGIRNSNIMAIAPTATISNIVGVSQSIEPTYQNLYVKSNMSGEFTTINPYLVNDLKALGIWDRTMVNDLKFYDGSLAKIDRIPQSIKDLYKTAFEIAAIWLVEAAARRQKWIDQSQSLNLYIADANGKKLNDIYRLSWYRGLKATYYLRAMGATSAEKSTVNKGVLNAVSPVEMATPAAVCSIDNPNCESCQ